MQLKLLGTAPGMPIIDRTHAALLWSFEEQGILIDAGPGTSIRIVQEKLSKDFISKIIITHFHPDHSVGIFMLLQMWLIQERTNKLTIYIPEGSKERFWNVLNYFYIFEEVLPFPIEIKQICNLQIHNYYITVFKNTHLDSYKKLFEKKSYINEGSSWSVIINTEQKRVLYSSDIGNIDDIKDEIIRSDLIIVDGMHIDLDELFITVSQIDRYKKIILNHLSVDLLANNDKLMDKVDKYELMNVIVAYDGWYLDIS